MSVRQGMISHVAELRGLSDTAIEQYTVGGTDYWSDEQLQDVLDMHAIDLNDVRLTPTPLNYSGTVEYKKFYLPKGVPKWLETNCDTTEGLPCETALQLFDHLGQVLSVSYTYTPRKGLFEFDSNISTGYVLVRATTYNMYLAAAQVWEEKAAHTTRLVEFKAGQTQVKEQQEHEHCLAMARYFKGKAGLRTVTMVRTGYGQR